MADLFKLNANDTLVKKYLTQAERGQIQFAHTSDAWSFEFHGGHETGTPFYIRPKDCNVNSNLTKFDTHTLTGTQLQYDAGKIKNGGHVDKMKKADKELLFTVVSNNWGRLCTLAKRFKGGDEQGADEAQRLAQAALAGPAANDKACPTPNCAGRVPIVASGKAMCPTCFQFS
jgi:hypothetical protein